MKTLLRVVLVLAVTLSATTFASAATGRPVTFRTDDGVTISATLFEASKHPAPAVILLHMLTRSRDDWQAVGSHLADSGIHALAIDFRGHGMSSSGAAGPDGEPDLNKMVLDVQAARAYLNSHTDLVRAGVIGVAGASVGANIAVMEAANDPAIKSVALLSVGIDYRNLRPEAALRKFSPRPALFIVGSNDTYAVRSMKTLAVIGPGTREQKTIDAGGHGTAMLAKDPTLVQALVDWFLRTLV